MVVDNLHILSTGGRPTETGAELVVHSDAVLTCSVTFQGFKPVARRNTEIFDPAGDLQLPQFPPRDAFNLVKPLDPAASGKRLSISVLKRYNHPNIVMPCVINVKRDGYVFGLTRGFSRGGLWSQGRRRLQAEVGLNPPAADRTRLRY